MNQEELDALKRVVEGTKNNTDIEMEDIEKVEIWIEHEQDEIDLENK